MNKKSLATLLADHPDNIWLAVIELEQSKIIGVIDDPIGVDPAALAVSYPLEYRVSYLMEGDYFGFTFIKPAEGLPEILYLNTEGGITVHRGSSQVGKVYLGALRDLGSSTTTCKARFLHS